MQMEGAKVPVFLIPPLEKSFQTAVFHIFEAEYFLPIIHC